MSSVGGAVASGIDVGDGLLLLKVPKWLSEEWLRAGPSATVADYDHKSGTLKLLSEPGSDKPRTLGITSRASPELFAFPRAGSGSDLDPAAAAKNAADGVPVVGAIREALSVRTDIRDTAYKNLLQRRADDSQITSGTRTLFLPKLQFLDQKVEVETIGTNAAGAAGGRLQGREAAVPPAEVLTAVERSLTTAGDDGLTCEELLAQLPFGCELTAVRDALAATAELQEVDGQRLFVRVHRGSAASTSLQPPPSALQPQLPTGAPLLKRRRAD